MGQVLPTPRLWQVSSGVERHQFGSGREGQGLHRSALAKRVDRGRMTADKMADVLSLIHPTASNEDLKGCDLIIEAVFENMKLKHEITKELEPMLAEGGIWGSNTSTLPITQLAEASVNAENFIGIHFFSPVDKMPLVEIIMGEKQVTSLSPKRSPTTPQIKTRLWSMTRSASSPPDFRHLS